MLTSASKKTPFMISFLQLGGNRHAVRKPTSAHEGGVAELADAADLKSVDF